MANRYLLDTKIISAILKHHEKVRERLRNAEHAAEEIFINTVSYYEIKRGLISVNATRQIKHFDEFRQNYRMLGTDTEQVLNKAAEIYADLKKRGELIPDNDIFIAAVTLIYDLTLVTDDRHFERVPSLTTENWLFQPLTLPADRPLEST